ncbi:MULTISPECIES: hypothetical protein [unclassified Leucobacter]|uniref:hypothetical protein n=1 Tax=unclassified Leucobacter TaxID=2621730 RepID=UPI0030192783
MNIFQIISVALVGLGLLALFWGMGAERKGVFIGTGVGFFVCAIAFLFLGNQFYEKSTPTWTVDKSTALVSLANASEVEGRGSLLGGHIDEKNVYRFVRETGDGALTLDEIDATGVRIVQDAKAGQSRIDYETCNYRGGKIWFLDDTSSALNSCGSRTTVHLPEGSVPSEFLIAPTN